MPSGKIAASCDKLCSTREKEKVLVRGLLALSPPAIKAPEGVSGALTSTAIDLPSGRLREALNVVVENRRPVASRRRMDGLRWLRLPADQLTHGDAQAIYRRDPNNGIDRRKAHQPFDRLRGEPFRFVAGRNASTRAGDPISLFVKMNPSYIRNIPAADGLPCGELEQRCRIGLKTGGCGKTTGRCMLSQRDTRWSWLLRLKDNTVARLTQNSAIAWRELLSACDSCREAEARLRVPGLVWKLPYYGYNL
jgi:hypothetical protein